MTLSKTEKSVLKRSPKDSSTCVLTELYYMSLPKPVLNKDNEITVAVGWENIFAKDTSDKRLLSNIDKEHLKVNKETSKQSN